MLSSSNDEWNQFPSGKQFFYLVTKISCPVRVNKGGYVSTSFLVIFKGEPCGDREKESSSRGQTAGPKGPRGMDGQNRLLPLGLALRHSRAPSLAWGIWNFFISLHTVPSGTEGRNRGEKVLCWGAGCLLGKSVKRREEGRVRAEKKGLSLSSAQVPSSHSWLTINPSPCPGCISHWVKGYISVTPRTSRMSSCRPSRIFSVSPPLLLPQA